MIRIGINGLGRVGRTLLRQAVLSDDIQVVGVNDLADARMLRTLLRRDSTFGPFPGEIEIGDDSLVIDGHKIPVFHASTPAELPWGELAVDVAVECTGKFRSADTAGGHLEAGARKVVISAPGKGVDATFVMGVNDQDYQPGHHDVVSNASCTTNCVAPMVKVLHEAFGVQHGFMSTVHAYTGDQNLLDAPHKDARRARSAAVNIIPTTTGAAKAVGEVLPELAGRLDGVALRVPVVDGSLVDLAVLLDREVTVAEVNAAFEAAAADARAARPAALRGRAVRLGGRHRRPGLLRLRLLADAGRRQLREGVRLVRQRVGLHRPAPRADPSGGHPPDDAVRAMKLEVRIHGRGGQGVVTAAELLSMAAFDQGLHAQALPSFGSERTGAPVMASCRISDQAIRSHDPVSRPDLLVVQDLTLLRDPRRPRRPARGRHGRGQHQPRPGRSRQGRPRARS